MALFFFFFFFSHRETKTTPLFLPTTLSACIYAVSPGLDVTLLLSGPVVGQYLDILFLESLQHQKTTQDVISDTELPRSFSPPYYPATKTECVSMSMGGDGLCGTCFRLNPDHF